MRKIVTTAIAAVMAATSFVGFGVTSSEAQPRHWGNRHYGPGPGYYGPRAYGPRYHHRRHRSNAGAAIAGGIIGLAAGSIIAGSAARANDSVAYCEQRFRSYDRASGTYLGYDGRRHACP